MKAYINYIGENAQLIIEDLNGNELFVSENLPNSELIKALLNKTLMTEDEQNKMLTPKRGWKNAWRAY